MTTSGNATGGNDVFSGKNRIFWWLVSQNPLAGAHGQSTIRWAWSVNWAAGDNCHTIQNAGVTGNSVSRYSNAGTVHAFSGSHVHTGDWPAVNSGSGGGFATGTYIIDHDSAGAANVVLSSHHVGTSGATSTASGTWALTAIPQSPATPTLLTNTRSSDTQAALSWTNNSTGTAPYANVKVYRQTDGGAWALIATLGVVTSYTDTTLSANHKYNHRVSAVGTNTVEVGYATGTSFWTTPGAPTACTATKQPNNDVVVTWTNQVSYSEYLTEIQESTDSGSTWANLSTSIASGTATYTHVAPSGAATHTYRVRAKTSSGTALNSAYSANSNTVTLLATANPPTGPSPSGVARDAAGSIVLSWTHNPADGTPQSKYQLQYKVDAGAYTTVGPTTSGASSHTITGGTLTNGHTITWHVATAGQNGTLSAYSADSAFTTSSKPTVAISTPASSYTTSHLTATWAYFQAESSAEAAWTATLSDAGSALLETVSGTNETSAVFATVLANTASYTVTVVVTSAAGLVSTVGSQSFTVAFLPPANVFVVAAFDNTVGAMTLTVTGDDPVGGTTEAISTVDVQRRINGGAWVTLATGLTLGAVGGVLTAILTDTTPITVGSNTYRVVAFSALPSSVMSAEVDAVTTETTWGYLSGGGSFATVARFRATPNFAPSTGRAKALYQFADRPKPVQLAGTALSFTLAVSGRLTSDSSTVGEFEALGRAQGVHCWRGPDGRRAFGSVPKVDTPQSRQYIGAAIAFTLTELDFVEGDQ
jgi:hypothetical protein